MQTGVEPSSCLLKQQWFTNPSSSPWICLSISSHRDNFRRWAHPDQMPDPPLLTPLDAGEQQVFISWTQCTRPSHLEKVDYVRGFYPGSHSFSHDPPLIRTHEGQSADEPANQEPSLRLRSSFFLLFMTDQCWTHIATAEPCICLSVSKL